MTHSLPTLRRALDRARIGLASLEEEDLRAERIHVANDFLENELLIYRESVERIARVHANIDAAHAVISGLKLLIARAEEEEARNAYAGSLLDAL